MINRSSVLLACQNISLEFANSKNGGGLHISDLVDGDHDILSIKGWQGRNECENCPVLFFCRGGCHQTPDNLRQAMCDCSYSDYIPIWAYTLELLTGFLPYYIDSDLPDNRKNLF